MRRMNEEKLAELENYIKDFISFHNGIAPKLGDITEHTGESKATAYRHVMELERRGVIEYSGKNTLKIKGGDGCSCFVRLPIIGAVVCGSPEEQEQYNEGFLAIPREWVEGECFLLRTYGDSMTDLGIDEGDLVLVRRTAQVHDGQIVVALTESGNTLKRYFNDNGRPRLHAENSSYPDNMRDIYPEELVIQGVALKLIKDII